MTRDPVPYKTVAQIAGQIKQLRALEARCAALQAEMIRACLAEIRSDVRSHRLRGHESAVERKRIIDENIANKAKAYLYLEWLATRLEEQAVMSHDEPIEGEPTCIEE